MLRITRIEVGYTVDTGEGPLDSTISLADFQWHCRRERVDDLIDDLVVLCEDVHRASDKVASR